MDLLFEGESLEVLLLGGSSGKVSAWAVLPWTSPRPHETLPGPLTDSSYGGKCTWFIREAHPDVSVTDTVVTLTCITPKILYNLAAPQQREERAAEGVLLGTPFLPPVPGGTEVGTGTGQCLLQVVQEERREHMGIAACLEDTQEHSGSGIMQLLNALPFDEGEDTLLNLSLDLGMFYHNAACSNNLSPTSLRGIWLAYSTAGPLFCFAGYLINLTNHFFFSLACGSQMLCCVQDVTQGSVHPFCVEKPWGVVMLNHIKVFLQPGQAEAESV